MASPVLIKKYGNRRLYDTGDSKYVTLDELAAKIRSGHDVRVVDAQTGEDLTQALMTQIVLETGNAAKFLPVQLLTQMIRLSDDALAEFFSRYVTNALDLYMQAKRGVQTLATYAPMTQIPMAATDALTRLWMGSPFGPGYPQPPPPPGYAYATGQAPYVAPPPPPDEPDSDGEHDGRRDAGRSDRGSRDRIERPDVGARASRDRARTERDRDDRTERGRVDDHADRADRADRTDRTDRTDRADRTDRGEPDRVDRVRHDRDDRNRNRDGRDERDERDGDDRDRADRDRDDRNRDDRDHDDRNRDDRNGRDDDMAAMRRELDELKQAIREGLSARPATATPRKRKKS